jgi:hypothetical protein
LAITSDELLELVVHHLVHLGKLAVEVGLELGLGQLVLRGDRGDVLDGHPLLEGAEGHVVELADGLEHLELLVHRAVGVHLVVRILLKEVLPYQPGYLQEELLVLGQRVRPDKLDDLLELVLPLKDVHEPASKLDELGAHVLGEPRVQGVAVEGVRGEPVDGGEVAAVGELGVQGPEHLDDAQRVLGDGFREVAARGRDRPGHGDRTLVASQGGDATRALVELGKLGGQVRGVPLLSRHLLEAARDLAHGLRPPGGGVGHEADGVTHVPVVLGDGDAGVDARLPCRHWHVGGVGDQDGPGHQRVSGGGVVQLGELLEHLGHLVAPLAAADVGDHLGIGPLGELVLGDGLARAEGAGDGRGASLGHGEQSVEDALASEHRDVGQELLHVGSGHPDGPLVHEPDLGPVGEGADYVLNLVRALAQLLDLAPSSGREQNPVRDGLALLHRAYDAPRLQLVPGLDRGLEVPGLRPVEARRVQATGDVVARLFGQHGQGSLDPVVDAPDEAGTELGHQGRSGVDDLLPGSYPRGVLVHLDDGLFVVDLDDLSHEALVAHKDHVVHLRCDARGRDDGPGDAVYLSSAFHLHTSCEFMISHRS